jgi:hypothetical protein
VKKTEGDAAVGSIVKITYKDGSVWEHQIIELSDRKHTIAYHVVNADPDITATSVEGELAFERVSDGDHTFMKWTTEFSNGAFYKISTSLSCRKSIISSYVSYFIAR